MLLIFDLDGVVYRGREPVPGMAELLSHLDARGDVIVYCTNNSRAHRSEYLERLRGLGLPATEDRIVTSARATALALVDPALVGPEVAWDRDRAGDGDGRPVMVVGAEGLAQEIRDVGLATVAPTEEGRAADPWAVVVGLDLELSHGRVSVAADVIRGGARFIATNRDPVFPTPTGFVAGAGSVVAAIEAPAGRGPDLIVGKPEPGLFIEAARVGGGEPGEAIVVGDGLTTDIAAAIRVGARSVLMLTGVTSQAQLETTPPNARPTLVARDAAELAAHLEALRG
ncbi:MAG: HAD-IIA family hydrolase [Chloroflexi bacterium]|nr:HAD-IIA family hydrolase [Chloroflexota bacterium]